MTATHNNDDDDNNAERTGAERARIISHGFGPARSISRNLERTTDLFLLLVVGFRYVFFRIVGYATRAHTHTRLVLYNFWRGVKTKTVATCGAAAAAAPMSDVRI